MTKRLLRQGFLQPRYKAGYSKHVGNRRVHTTRGFCPPNVWYLQAFGSFDFFRGFLSFRLLSVPFASFRSLFLSFKFLPSIGAVFPQLFFSTKPPPANTKINRKEKEKPRRLDRSVVVLCRNCRRIGHRHCFCRICSVELSRARESDGSVQDSRLAAVGGFISFAYTVCRARAICLSPVSTNSNSSSPRFHCKQHL